MKDKKLEVFSHRVDGHCPREIRPSGAWENFPCQFIFFLALKVSLNICTLVMITMPILQGSYWDKMISYIQSAYHSSTRSSKY